MDIIGKNGGDYPQAGRLRRGQVLDDLHASPYPFEAHLSHEGVEPFPPPAPAPCVMELLGEEVEGLIRRKAMRERGPHHRRTGFRRVVADVGFDEPRVQVQQRDRRVGWTHERLGEYIESELVVGAPPFVVRSHQRLAVRQHEVGFGGKATPGVLHRHV